MDLGDVFKLGIETLKSLHDELNRANVEPGGLIVTATDEKIYTIFKGGRLVVTSRFTYYPNNTPMYCTSPYRPNLVEFENGNNRDEIEEVVESTTFNELSTTTFPHSSSITTPCHKDEPLDEMKSSPSTKISSVYFDESFTKY